MKKYLLKMTALVLFIGTLASCSEDKVYYDEAKGPVLASFTNDSKLFGVTPKKQQDTILVQVSALSKVDRTFTIEVDTVNTTAAKNQYTLVTSSFVVPANQYVGKMLVQAAYTGDLNTPSVDLVLNLTSFPDAHLEPNHSKFKMTIFQSCDYDGTKVGTNFTAGVVANPFQSYPGEVAPSFDTNGVMKQTKSHEFSMTTLWGPNFISSVVNNSKYDGMYLAPGKIVVNNDNSITIVPDPSADYLTGGTGVYDPCTNTFTYTLTETLLSPDGTPNLTVTVTLTPN